MFDQALKEGYHILLVWGSNTPPNDLESIVKTMTSQVGSTGKVQVENESILMRSDHRNSSFDVVISGTKSSPFLQSEELLEEILKLLKPNGSLLLFENTDETPIDKLKSSLTLTGYTNINLMETDNEKNVMKVRCQKPSFEVGKSSKLPLSFHKKATNPSITKIWTLSASDMNDDDVDIIDSDSLLDAEDLKRPDFSAIKTDCGTSKSGKRKACKGCTCGLKEELDGAPAPTQKSACGSCYLGDAFRCASCPYLGMPPFKPGEQITLSARQLNPDIQT